MKYALTGLIIAAQLFSINAMNPNLGKEDLVQLELSPELLKKILAEATLKKSLAFETANDNASRFMMANRRLELTGKRVKELDDLIADLKSRGIQNIKLLVSGVRPIEHYPEGMREAVIGDALATVFILSWLPAYDKEAGLNAMQLFAELSVKYPAYVSKFMQAANKKMSSDVKPSADQSKGKELYDAAFKGNLSKVKELLAVGAPVNFRHPTEQDHWTPLQVAAFYGKPQVVEALVNAGADIELQNDAGYTAVYAAIKGNKLDVVKFLVGKGAKLDAKTQSGNTALSEARRIGNKEMTTFLTQSGAQ